jgi:hypothetical protein
VSLSCAVALAGATAALLYSPAAAQQAPAGIAKPWTLPRTADGKPDLQGNWSNVTITPFERPQGQGPTLTREQVAAMEKAVTDRIEERNQPSDPNRPAPPQGGDGSTGAAGMVGGYNNFWIDSGENVLRVNGEYRSSIVVDPPDGRIPPMSDAYRAAQKQRLGGGRGRAGMGPFDNPEQRALGERCIVSFGSNAGPPMIPNGFYNNNYTFVQTKDHLMILTEMVHDVRIVRLNATEHLPKDIRPWFGDSIGRWEGDTLVVETTNFNPMQSFRGASENLKVIERFTRVGPNAITYRFTIEDPMWSRPWSGELSFNRLDELVYEYACHEGNYALANILSGARQQEKAAAATTTR